MEDIQASFSQLQVSMLENELIQTFLDPIEEIIQESREYWEPQVLGSIY